MIISTKVKPPCVDKWNEMYANINWKIVFTKAIKATQDAKLKWFQFRILHRIIPTNRYLHIRKLVDSPLCTFGCHEEETIAHLFYDCPVVQLFWADVLIWIHSQCTHCDKFYFTEELVVLGTKQNTRTDCVIDFIILLAKWHIYKCKLQNKSPHLLAFKNMLKNRYLLERYNSFTQCKYDKFTASWLPYVNLIK